MRDNLEQVGSGGKELSLNDNTKMAKISRSYHIKTPAAAWLIHVV